MPRPEPRPAVVLLGNPGPDYRNPKQLGSHCQFNYIYVDDLDAHHAQATAAGAKIVVELETADYGDRRYAAEDPEGHQWWFAERVTDVD